MAVAAYGSLVSLINVLDNVHYRAKMRRLHVDIKLIESLQEGINFLVDYVEVHSEREGHKGDLWRQLSRMAFDAEQMFDLHVVDQLLLRSQGHKGDLGFLAFNEDVETVIQQVEFIKKELLVVEEDVPTGKQPQMAAPRGDSSSTALSGKSIMVGFEDHLHQILDRLTSDQRDLQIIPIVGMGGIGKTTLAQNVYNHARIREHFDIHIWLTISQEYSVHQILLGLLNHPVVKNIGGNFHELGENLYKELFGRRYLIVMDDVWGVDAWNDLRVFFPDNSNRSRVMVTTRLADLAGSLGWQDPYVVTFLNEDKSWNLLCQTIFAQEEYPYPEFEEIGRSIARSCRGLPMEIVTIGRHLAHSDMTKESWEFVAENMKSFGDIEDYQHCMEVLHLSYKKLPIHLKLCFIYMRNFPEDEEINNNLLMELWKAEGFIRPNNGKDLMEIGRNYLKDLNVRNLIARANDLFAIFPEEEDAFHMHDLFRDLCLKEWEKEQYIYSPKIQTFTLSPRKAQDACFHCGTLHPAAEATNLREFFVISQTTTSKVDLVICENCEMMYSELRRPRLVKVARLVENDDVGNGNNMIKELVLHTHVSYAKVDVGSYFLEIVSPCMIQLLWNLQTLILDSSHGLPIVLPPEIWELSQLWRIETSNSGHSLVLPNPTDTHDMGEDFVILKNLHGLDTIHNLECTREILNRIPNLWYLGIKYEDDELEEDGIQRLYNSLCNLAHLQKLASLVIKGAALEHAVFPKSLKHLQLTRCKISWQDITVVVGSLPYLEVLYLERSGEGPEWTLVKGGFLRLKLMYLKYCDLRCWDADQFHFPMLMMLYLEGLTLLEEIPSGIEDIATLQVIGIEDCNEAAEKSAKKIWQDQQDLGNDSFEIYIDFEKYLGEDEI